jgi:hypothetical protein
LWYNEFTPVITYFVQNDTVVTIEEGLRLFFFLCIFWDFLINKAPCATGCLRAEVAHGALLMRKSVNVQNKKEPELFLGAIILR